MYLVISGTCLTPKRLFSVYLAFSNRFGRVQFCSSYSYLEEVPCLLILKILVELIDLHFVGGVRNDGTLTWLESISMSLSAVLAVLLFFFFLLGLDCKVTDFLF